MSLCKQRCCYFVTMQVIIGEWWNCIQRNIVFIQKGFTWYVNILTYRFIAYIKTQVVFIIHVIIESGINRRTGHFQRTSSRHTGCWVVHYEIARIGGIDIQFLQIGEPSYIKGYFAHRIIETTGCLIVGLLNGFIFSPALPFMPYLASFFRIIFIIHRYCLHTYLKVTYDFNTLDVRREKFVKKSLSRCLSIHLDNKVAAAVKCYIILKIDIDLWYFL